MKVINLLADAYKSFEKSFDGSGVFIFPELRSCLQRPMDCAQDLTPIPTILHQRLNAEVKDFDAVAFEEEQSQRGHQAAEQEGAGVQPTDADDPFVNSHRGRCIGEEDPGQFATQGLPCAVVLRRRGAYSPTE
ncbi:hypothetical protein BDM02DRAFT_3119739 [Thelephora ganbajun]|uniref:Uncharacterized protein n=1 Tax=Thelephora ganbajun TaxID=370292 RepID=A0ACB6Z7S8_THEGA|nr:hypothetical protein BDM02DRAFT_3119739 [Thelephora ganbajun]